MTNHLNSIIVSFYNNWHLTHRCLLDLYNNIPNNCEVVLVNDASTENVAGGVGWWQKQGSGRYPVRYTRNETNLGFGGSYNRGATFAKGDILILLSNDVLIFSPFVEEIGRIIDQNPNVFIGGEIIDFPSGWNDLDDTFIPYCNGWLLACTKENWKKIGGFDPIYDRFDYEDIDISLTAMSLGMELRALRTAKLRHLGGQTIASLGVDRQKATMINRDRFRNKWQGKVGFMKDMTISKYRVCRASNYLMRGEWDGET